MTGPTDLSLDEVRGFCSPDVGLHYIDTMGKNAHLLLRDPDVQRLVWATRAAQQAVTWNETIAAAAFSYRNLHDPEFDPPLNFQRDGVVDTRGQSLVDPYVNPGHIIAPYTKETVDINGQSQFTYSEVHYLTDAGRQAMHDQEKKLKEAGVEQKDERQQFDHAKAFKLATSDSQRLKAGEDFQKVANQLENAVKNASNSYFRQRRTAGVASVRDAKHKSRQGRGGGGEGASRDHHHQSTAHKPAGRSQRS